MASTTAGRSGSSADEVHAVELHHSSGVVFKINLNTYELNRANEDPKFLDEILTKYYNLYQKGYVFGEESDPTASQTTDPTHNLPNNVNSCNEEEVDEDEVEDETRNSENAREFVGEDEEALIIAVSERPPLYDFKLPLEQRGRQQTRALWEEIISELHVNMSVEAIMKKWKNIRDSYIRARANINKKLRSGASAQDKIIADRIKSRHRNYELLTFLGDTLNKRSTISNLDADQHSPPSPALIPLLTPSSSRGSSRGEKSDLSTADEAFLNTINNICSKPTTTSLSATQHFCMRLAEGLERLPVHVRNKLEIEFLTKTSEAEAEYCC